MSKSVIGPALQTGLAAIWDEGKKQTENAKEENLRKGQDHGNGESWKSEFSV